MVRIVKKPEDRKAEIIKTARHLFLARDYDQTTMQDVVEAVGVAKGTVYYYFPSKEDLLEAVIADINAEAYELMAAALEASEGNALDCLKVLVSAGRIEGEETALLEVIHRPGSAGMHARLLAAAIQKQAPLYARVVEQGCREGLFDCESPLETSEFILTGIQFLTDTGIYSWSGEDLARRGSAFPNLLERLLSAPAGSFQTLFQPNLKDDTNQ
jgi:AcrR family transcriptional regulator